MRTERNAMLPNPENQALYIMAMAGTFDTTVSFFDDIENISKPENKKVVNAAKAADKAIKAKQANAAEVDEEIDDMKKAIKEAKAARRHIDFVTQHEKYESLTAHISQMRRALDDLTAKRAEIMADTLPPEEYKNIIFALVYEVEKDKARRTVEVMQHIEAIAALTAADFNERLYANAALLSLQAEFNADAYKDTNDGYTGEMYDNYFERFQFMLNDDMDSINRYVTRSNEVKALKEKAEAINNAPAAAVEK